MKKRIKEWLALCRAWRQLNRWSPLAERRVEWTDADANKLADFLNSETGRKLQVILQDGAITQCHFSVGQAGMAEHATGWANGYRRAVSELLSLTKSQPSDLLATDEPDGGAAQAFIDSLTP